MDVAGDSRGSLEAAVDAVRRTVLARVDDRALAEDIVQETLVKVAEAQRRLDPDSVQGYAISTARNLIVDHARRSERDRRHIHRLIETDEQAGPEGTIEQHEETAALASALGEVTADERRLLVMHEVDQIDVGSIAELEDTSRGAMAMRLARARASLRLEYVLAFRRVTLPTAHCRNVLLALSAGDGRRQEALGAEHHVRECPVCDDLAEVLSSRRRALVGWAGLVGAVGAAAAFLGRKVAGRPVVASVTAATVVAATAFAVVRLNDNPPPADSTPVTTAGAPATVPAATVVATPAPAPPQAVGPLIIGATVVPPAPPGGLVALAGQPVTASGMVVDEVPADEGFWIAIGPGQRLWVQLTGAGESPATVVAGARVTLRGVLRAASAAPGVPGAQAAEVHAAGAYVEAPFDAVAVSA